MAIMGILLMVIGGYWRLLYCKPLVVILLVAILLVMILGYIMTIGGYCIISYYWLFMLYYHYW